MYSLVVKLQKSTFFRQVSNLPLPTGWQEARTAQGEVYFMNHQTRTTSWVDPRLQRKYSPYFDIFK